tara:strand:+ start:2316 stop:2864 length:549 start_codon:yes stop_codon:yes gene_type:complete
MSNTKHEIVFQYNLLASELKVSKSTLTRAMKLVDDLNESKEYIEIQKLENSKYFLKFYPNGKVQTSKTTSKDVELLDFLNDYYKKHDIHYPELIKHKPYITKVLKKLSVVMMAKGVEVNETNLNETFKVFFNSIPQWWQQNQFTLPAIHKNFTKIINQIKSKNKKSIKYQKTTEQVDNLKFK